MARSFRNNRLSENIRLFWTRLFRHILVYTDEEAEYLRHRGFGDHYVLGINNGLDQAAIDRAAADWPDVELNEWRKAGGLDGRVLILSCARLEPKNRLDQVVEALPFIVTRVPNVLWCIIGSGTKLRELIAMVDRVGGSEHVRFVGGTYDEKELAPWFLSSELLIHPAAVGLSLIHAYGYGLPAVLNDNPRAHGPEYAAFESGKTGWAYRENDPKDLAEKIVRLLNDKESRKTMGAYAYGLTKDKYNVDIMADRFVQIAREAFRSRRHEIQRYR
jgi:glycosyltransferase involved in cell wall biosynthesis